MKKGLLIAVSAISLWAVSCKKSESGNKNVLKADNSGAILADNGKVDSPSITIQTSTERKL
ncbi:hypothetical protein ACFP3I_25505 [Chryseobacterium arachidis]|uniref:hypothetical protein n=1 Tax=Chryseobacterium arachidis TaxID=1416778 RepID=UPI0036080FBC